MLALATILMMGALVSQPAQAQTFSVLHNFTGNADGGNPDVGLIRDRAGNLYGTTSFGGDPYCNHQLGCGVVFRLDLTGKETVLYAPSKGHGNIFPGSVVRDAAGNFYGPAGGGLKHFGTVFRLSANGTETQEYAFRGGADGAYPTNLIRDRAGNLYGTTVYGGNFSCYALGCGVVFELHGHHETILHTFTGGTDGAIPQAGLIRDQAGNLYGTTSQGGGSGCFENRGCGTVFKIGTNGIETVLYSFTGTAGDGQTPAASLIRDSAGNLYGTTTFGGDVSCNPPSGCGTVFKLSTRGKETVLYSFTGAPDGEFPSALIRDAKGDAYGTTAFGGNATCNAPLGCGTVFELDTTGKETILYRFSGTDGEQPYASLLRDRAGNLFGTTYYGGSSGTGCFAGLGCGVVFKITP